MQINHKSYKLDNGDVLIESCVIGSRIPGAIERYTYQRNKFIEESLLKSMSNEQLNELKQSVDTELATRTFDYSILLNFSNNYKYLIPNFNNADIFFQIGGRCSGKTQSGMRECFFLAFGLNKKVACVRSNSFLINNYETIAQSILNEYSISFFEIDGLIRIVGNDGTLYKNGTIKTLPRLTNFDVIYVDDAECLTKSESKKILSFAEEHKIKLIFNIPFYKKDVEIYKICLSKSEKLKILCLESNYLYNEYCPSEIKEYAIKQISNLSKSECERIWGV